MRTVRLGFEILSKTGFEIQFAGLSKFNPELSNSFDIWDHEGFVSFYNSSQPNFLLRTREKDQTTPLPNLIELGGIRLPVRDSDEGRKSRPGSAAARASSRDRRGLPPAGSRRP